jgi:hypothetical protein
MRSCLAGHETVNMVVERAQRFLLNVRIHYRIEGEENWHGGDVVNMSSTGVLFHGESKAKKGSRIEISIDLPTMKDARLSAKIVAKGVIVRTFEAEAPNTGALLAAQLTLSRLLRL